ncbi:MAG: AAA family ATPase [Magnetococcales bacterium]|nr:AAA family ATPase [Magnetococcales bacterium]
MHSLKIRRFKQFGEYEATFTEPSLDIPRDLVVLIGDNGKGKSTILQAIALVLGMATRQLASPDRLEWPGFDYALAGGAWPLPTEIELTVVFTREETEAVIECFKLSSTAKNAALVPDNQQIVTITLAGNCLKTRKPQQKLQFRGREYAGKVLKQLPDNFDIFKKIGSVFWYHEHRQATSLMRDSRAGSLSPLSADDQLRIHLDQWHNFHRRVVGNEFDLRPGQKDLFKEIHDAWQRVFPDRSFVGSHPRDFGDSIAPRFYLSDGQRYYELAEMSAGERAILPILIDFARLNIHNSVVLIDEVELHLHPPLQHAMVRALSHLGKNNQFIITTHSQSVLDVVFDSDIHRVNFYDS